MGGRGGGISNRVSRVELFAHSRVKTRPKTARFVVCLRDVTRDYCSNIRVATCSLKPELSRFFAAAVKARMDLLRNNACVIFWRTTSR